MLVKWQNVNTPYLTNRPVKISIKNIFILSQHIYIRQTVFVLVVPIGQPSFLQNCQTTKCSEHFLPSILTDGTVIFLRFMYSALPLASYTDKLIVWLFSPVSVNLYRKENPFGRSAQLKASFEYHTNTPLPNQ